MLHWLRQLFCIHEGIPQLNYKDAKIGRIQVLHCAKCGKVWLRQYGGQ